MGHKVKKSDDRSRYRHRSRSPDSRSSRSQKNRYEEKSIHTKKAIDVKSKLKSSLSSAISDLKSNVKGNESSHFSKNSNLHVDLFDSVTRQAEIDRINNDDEGFKPAAFKSSLNEKSSQSKSSDAQKTHDQAMFGSSWQAKDLEKKPGSIKIKQENFSMISHQSQLEPELPKSSFPLAHERLSMDLEIKQKQWLALFVERRKQILDGML